MVFWFAGWAWLVRLHQASASIPPAHLLVRAMAMWVTSSDSAPLARGPLGAKDSAERWASSCHQRWEASLKSCRASTAKLRNKNAERPRLGSEKPSCWFSGAKGKPKSHLGGMDEPRYQGNPPENQKVVWGGKRNQKSHGRKPSSLLIPKPIFFQHCAHLNHSSDFEAHTTSQEP